MERYDSYRDSGVDWIGEIPSHWIVRRNKYFTSQRKDKSETGKEELLSVSEYQGVVPRRVIRDGEEHLSRSESFEGYLMVSPGELVSNIMLMWKTGLGVSEYEGLVSPAYSVFRFTHGSPKYFHYLFRTSQYTSEYRRNSTGVIESRLRLYDDSFGRLPSHFPPLHEQEQIVEYLDRKTTLIDSMIEKTVRKIELLKEKRTSLINEVVTKGLNPDVEMKDSGVEWIGEIPSHWSSKKLGYSIETIVPMRDKPEKLDGEIPWIRIEDRVGRHIKGSKSGQGVSVQTIEEMNLKVFPVGTVLTTCSCSFGTSMIVDVPMVSNQTFIGLVPNRRQLLSEFLFYELEIWGDELDRLSSGSIQKYLSRDNFKSLRFIFPPLREQEHIVEYLDKQTSIIDSTITTEEKRIELLIEYRQSLISEVVTGKVKVTRNE